MGEYTVKKPEDIREAGKSAQESDQHPIILKVDSGLFRYQYSEIHAAMCEFIHAMDSAKKSYCAETDLPHATAVKDLSRVVCLFSIRDEYAVVDWQRSRVSICSDAPAANERLRGGLSKSVELKQETVDHAVAYLVNRGYVDAEARDVFHSVRYCEDALDKNTLYFFYDVNVLNRASLFALDHFNEIVSSIAGRQYRLQWYIRIAPWVFRYNVQNNRIGWERAWKYAKKCSADRILDFSVRIPSDKSLAESDVTNLKYIYPILDALRDRCFVHIEQEDLSDEKDEQYRLNAFLYRLQDYPNHIFVNGVKPYLTDKSSDIFPIISADYRNYATLKLPYEKGHSAPLGMIPDYEKWINRTDNYAGTAELNLAATAKENIRNSIVKRLNEERPRMSSLAFAILVFLVRNLIGQKTLFDLKNSTYDRGIFDKLCADSDGYAEGLYQVIENACLYSHGHKAFFCMRLHKTDKDASLGKDAFEKESLTRVRLYKKYKPIIDNNNIFNDGRYKYFLEFSVLDESTEDAFDTDTNRLGLGIVECFNVNNKIGDESQINSIGNILDMTEDEYKLRITAGSPYNGEFYWRHYGLRWFSRIVSKNNGMFFVLSPDKQDGAKYYPDSVKGQASDLYENGGVYSTEYSILLPVSYEWETETGPSSATVGELFDPTYLALVGTDNASVRQCDIGCIREQPNGYEAIRDLYENLMNCKAPGYGDCIYLDGSDCDFCHVEILAKAIFRCIYAKRKGIEVSKYFPIHIAVYFGSKKKYVSEFARIFTIFYEKIGKNTYMDKVQIALCSARDDGKGNGVCFQIAGKNIASSYETANVFAYYNSEYSLKFLPLLRYLTSESKKENESAVPQYPFDLVLREKGNESLFAERMKRALDTDICKEEYGCKIVNTHVRISSRIHLGTFYEAELLFHNIGNVYRFAYLIAGNIVREMSEKKLKHVLLVGYEQYSATLVQQVKALVGTYFGQESHICLAIISSAEDGTSKIRYFAQKPAANDGEGIDIYTIIPIGTTMSTIYKLHNLVKNDLKLPQMNFCGNHSLVAVGHDLLLDETGEPDDSDEKTVMLYWDHVDHASKSIFVQPEKSGEEGITVRYYLTADSKWQKADDCKWCKMGRDATKRWSRYRPLIQVDGSSTKLDAIFRLKERNGGSFVSGDPSRKNLPLTEISVNENGEKVTRYNKACLEKLRPDIRSFDAEALPPIIFSHICRGNNHYQFYFDFLKMTEQNYSDIVIWAKKQASSIPSHSFNVVLSPLDINNSLFLKIVIDNVFSSSLRFLHIDISNTYKEDARVKFKYMAEEFQKIRQYNHSAAINFYYVDDSMLTGQTIMRGRMFLRMLLDESGTEYRDITVFRKIFLLLNRSSFDTINNYVNDPRENLHCYMTLFAPSYNTSNDLCPACRIRQQYELLRKRSASVDVAREFDRLAEKHVKRSPDEYIRWLDQKVKTSHAYFAWLRLWLYEKSGDAFSDMREELVTYMSRFTKKEDEKGIPIPPQERLERISHTTLNGFFDVEDIAAPEQKRYTNLIKYIVTERAYLRLETMNEAYYHLLFSEEAGKRGNDVDKMYLAITTMISDGCDRCDNTYDKMERLLSYVKVISREHLSSYYAIRFAIIRVMLDILDCLVAPDPESVHKGPGFKSIINTIRKNPLPYHQYRLFETIIHRLALLQVPQVYDEKNIKQMLQSNAYGSLVNQWEKLKNNGAELTEVPTEETALEKYIVSIKTATMLTKDDAACIDLLRQVDAFQPKEKRDGDK